MSNSQARVNEVFAEAAQLFAEKNRHYGDSWRNQGWRGNVSRILEKAGRVRTMVWRNGDVLLNGGSEHPRETLLDMMNTIAFAIINIDDRVEWGTEPYARDIPAPLPPMPEWARPAHGTVDYPNELPSYGDQPGPAPYEKSGGVPEQTMVQPIVGNVPTPGEEPAEEKPRPHRRVTVTDRGSGPRKAPQK